MPEFTFHMRANLRNPIEATITAEDYEEAQERLGAHLDATLDHDEVAFSSITVIDVKQDGFEADYADPFDVFPPRTKTIFILVTDWRGHIDIEKFDTEAGRNDRMLEVVSNECGKSTDELKPQLNELGGNGLLTELYGDSTSLWFETDEFEVTL